MQPITVYHGTMTGKNNEHLRSFQTRGICPLKGVVPVAQQKDGFFVRSKQADVMNRFSDEATDEYV